jgi:hypothetical protein
LSEALNCSACNRMGFGSGQKSREVTVLSQE